MAKEEQSDAQAAKVKAKPARKRRRKTKKLPPYNVVLLNDDDHTYEYVIEMLQKLFGHSEERAFKMAEEVDTTGRVIVYTTHRELAELKRDQIHAFGADKRWASSQGSMSAVVEPAN
ncbi:MAG TPA: ATP-dependent Clp protease adaptor ClpS [Tepidisphaeraceae bacterium]|jgi:ATP-dependent Clp protease adaptor protein ClpS